MILVAKSPLKWAPRELEPKLQKLSLECEGAPRIEEDQVEFSRQISGFGAGLV